MSDPVIQVNFDGNPGIEVTQGEDRSIVITVSQVGTNTPVNLTGGVVEVNLPLQGGGSIKRTSGVVAVPSIAVNVNPANTVSLTDHGFVTGDPIQVAAQGGGSLPGGLSALTNYLILVIDNNTFQITDTAGNVISLTSQGTVGFNVSNATDLAITNAALGQMTLVLRALVTQAINAALAQSFQVAYVLSNKTRIALVENQLDCFAQPCP